VTLPSIRPDRWSEYSSRAASASSKGLLLGRVSQFILQPRRSHRLLADAASYQPMEFQNFRASRSVPLARPGEVERDLELPERSLVATVELYNRNAARGEDPLFHKARQWLAPLEKPPFVALDCRIDHCFYSSFTLGGLDTLPTGEVLTEDRSVVSGLYAAGRTACGLPRWGGGYSSGCRSRMLRSSGGRPERDAEPDRTCRLRRAPSVAPKPSRGSPTS
jgi:hypothetical protein